jgi:hypothetical protein
MDRPLEKEKTDVGSNRPGAGERTAPKRRSRHLMCRTPLWGIAGFIGSVYFAWISFSHVANNEYEWPHDPWTAATYIVWILLLAILALDTRCLRERLLFGVLVLNFLAGCGLTFWHGISSAEVRGARIGTGALWTAAALLSLTTLEGAAERQRRDGR